MAGQAYFPLNILALPIWGLLLLAGIFIWIPLYLYQVLEYHRAHQSRKPGQIPPAFPVPFPPLGTLLPLIWDARHTLNRYTSYNGHATVARLALLPGKNAFLYADPAVVRQIWKQSSLLDFRPMSTHFMTSVCGMSKKAASLRMDNPDSKVQTLPGSKITNHPPVHRILSESNRKSLTGHGLSTTLQRYRNAFITRTSELVPERLDSDWVQMENFTTFIQDTCGAAAIEAIFGPKIMEMHPTFVRNFFEFDEITPWLLMRLPSRKARKMRSALLYQFKTWAQHARTMFAETDIYEDGDGDPFWGSAWTRYRHEALAPYFDDDALSSHDLGVAWGALANTVPCSLMTAIHVLQDSALSDHLKRDIDENCRGDMESGGGQSIDPKKLSKNPLLSSIYAETLRLHMSVSIPVVPQHGELTLGKWRIPKASYGLIPVACCHTNKDVWNTGDGAHPVTSFWAERFLVDPDDALSGPVRPGAEIATYKPRVNQERTDLDKVQPYFTTEGLEGSWIPYGGGQNMCPGRFLSKGIIEFTTAFLLTKFDVELLANENDIVMDKKRFGLGADVPTSAIPFRIRRRTST